MRAAWARLAPALLVSVAVHAAAITSLDRYAAPLRAMGPGWRPGHVLSVALKLAPVHPSGDVTTSSEAPGLDIERKDIEHKGSAQPPVPSPSTATRGLPLATYFFARDEVDAPATAISDVMLHYPREAFAAGTHGTVTLEVFVDARGSVVRTAVVDAVPRGIFEDAAREAIGQLRYRPAQREGSAVRSRRLVQVVFDPNPALVPPPRSASEADPQGTRQRAGTGAVSGR
jgi:protein TonB